MVDAFRFARSLIMRGTCERKHKQGSHVSVTMAFWALRRSPLHMFRDFPQDRFPNQWRAKQCPWLPHNSPAVSLPLLR